MASKINGKRLIFPGLLLIASSCCGAGTGEAENELQRLQMDIPSLYLINGMFFSAEQNKKFAGFLEESAGIQEQNQKAIRQFIAGNRKEIDQLLDQMISGKKETAQPAVLKKARPDAQLFKTRSEWQKLISRNQKGLDETAEKTLAMLTPAQRDILNRFVPCFIPPGDFRNPERVGQADADTSLGETMLARLRGVPAARLNDAIERALDGLAPYIMKQQHTELTKPQIEELRDELRPSLKELTDRIRGMSESDFQLEKVNLARQFLCLHNAEGNSKGGDALMKIKHYLLNPGIIATIAQRAGDPTAAFSPGQSAPAKPGKPEITPAAALEDIRQKNEAFQTASLINNLQLTAGQCRQMLPCVQKAVAARAEVAQEASAIFPQALKAYAALKKELENQQSSPQTEQEAGKYHHQLKMLYSDKLAKTLSDCQTEMDLLLSADQVAFLIGRQGGKKMERCQDNQSQRNIMVVRSRAEAVFDAVDKMNDREFADSRRKLCADFITSCVTIGVVPGNDINEKAEIDRVEQVLSRARNMRRSEYLKSRDDLTAEICPKHSTPRPAVFGWQKNMGDQLEVVNPTTQLLLSQTGLTLLEKKIKAGN